MSRLPRNDGWNSIDYDLGLDADENSRIGKILNDACHVFHGHAGGTWLEHDKDRYARLLAAEIRRRRRVVKRLLDTDDRVVKMLTYRAIELLEAADGE